jgi:hypothetical protein
MAQARRTGRGVQIGSWKLPNSRAAEATERIVTWCREAAAGCRRPFGIDHFDLAVACGNGAGSVESRRFLRLRPMDLYKDDLVAELKGLGSSVNQGDLHFAVALFFWGEAAHRALPPTSTR